MNGSDNITTPSGSRSMTQPSLASSSLPPLSPSSSTFRRNSLPSMSFSPSAPVESRDSSIKVNKNPSLPPLVDGEEDASWLEFGSSDYTDDELNKIAKSTKLQDIAKSTKLQEIVSDPKKVRRILKNRELAASSKQRKLKYMIDLEHRIKFLENKNALIFEKIKLLEKDKTILMNEKKEITIQIESLEQQAQLRDALTEKLHVEIERLKVITISNEKGSVELQRLKMETCEVLQYRREFDRSNMQGMDPNMFTWSQPNLGFYGQI
ncbi:Basic-leucine zipper (bZIP) transcription factor family protein [Arabidopsis thaliana]|uniref:BZIP transcription factor family protein n=1 Tax=Arabidopsis thaliana TaxID=3702 RepID=Q9SKG1_ARATH|nr:Basic-leucine zipper (bZIP) transcription factor family protein [Arabidopsis thaliana]AAD20651.1 bZIP transcription factor family protein [Arabidopsis thaliana]AAM15428.1 bZIP transcription factor family protein [Arabidopsis thaliana]AEC06209.1 Basic-leucine zipper (bZIP) transcription factor family protein [Arabidopsis thaliana]|eukprot:NP_565355.1 Basic-leucine zipper (bZIP) transcription factor family protein [Arabidopsis thaliana]